MANWPENKNGGINSMDDYTKKCLRYVNPFLRESDVKRYVWINDDELFLEMQDGKKHIYDDTIKGSRIIPYTLDTITEDEWWFEFRHNLNNIMMRNGISQNELAKRLNKSQSMVSRYITGESRPDPFMIQRIARVIECNYVDLIFRNY